MDEIMCTHTPFIPLTKMKNLQINIEAQGTWNSQSSSFQIISQEQSRTSLCLSSSGFSMGILNENPTLRIPPPEVNESETSPRPYFVKQGLGLPIKKVVKSYLRGF